MKISVIGYGKFGKAIGSLLRRNKVEFSYVDEGQKLTEQPDIIFLCTTTQNLRKAIKSNKKFLNKKTIFVNCSKGIEIKTQKLPFQIVKEEFNPKHYYSLSGLSFAKDIIERQPTLVSLGYGDNKRTYIKKIKKTLETPYFKIKETKDYQAIELAGAIKNVYAILCGFSDGLGYGENTKATLVINALNEYKTLARKSKFKYSTLAISGIIGDFVFTCSSNKSRNYKYGFALAKMPLRKVQEKFEKSTIEGVSTSEALQKMLKKQRIKLPLADLTQEILKKGNRAKAKFDLF